MWSIFVSTIGVIFWSCKAIAEKAASNKAGAYAKERNAVIEKWESQTTDRRLERAIRDSHYTSVFIEQCRKATAFIRSIPGLENANLDLVSTKRSRYYVSMFLLYWQMVQQGKLPAIHNVELGNYLGLSIDTPLPNKSRIAFGMWVEQSLRSHGVENARLYCINRDRASFVWEPFVLDTDSAISIRDPSLEDKIPGR